MKILNAVGYCRFSSDKQREESIEAQQEAILRFAKENGYFISKWYIDRAYTATNDNRPEFQRMITDSDKQEFRFVITHKRDRFSRDEYDPAVYKKQLKKNKVKVLYAAEPNLTGVAGIYLDKMYEANAASYSINLASEVRKGMRMNAKKAQCNGGVAPYGYKRVPRKDKHGEVIISTKGRVLHDTVIDPVKAEAVKMLFNMTLAGKTQKEILHEFNLKGYKNAHGGNFIEQSLDNLLRNEKYTGTYIFDPSRKYKAEEGIDEDDLAEDSEHRIIRVDGGLPQIVSQDTFNAVQMILGARKHKPSSRAKVDYLLTGKVVCGKCGSGFSGSTHYKQGQPYFYYRCGREKENCKLVSVRKEPLENFVISEMEKVVQNDEFVSQILERFVEFYKEQKNNSVVVNRLEDERIKVEKQIENLVNVITESGNFSPVFQSKLDALTNEQAEILASLKRESSVNLDEFVTKEEIRRTYFRVLNLLKSGEIADKAAIINTLLNRVIVYKDRIEIFVNLLPLKNSTADLQITDSDLWTYGLLESDTRQNTTNMDVIPSENSYGDPHRARTYDTEIKSLLLYQLS